MIQKEKSFLQKLINFSGPGYLIAVGYMDPGNWATDIAGGSQFGYKLLFVILISNFMAVILQYLSLKLGIVTNMDLAQACNSNYTPKMNIFLWILAEIAIIACDLAEVIGSALALNLIFNIPLSIGVLITAADVLLILGFKEKKFKYIEILIISLIFIILACFIVNLILAKPNFHDVLNGFLPTSQILKNKEMLFIALGILGATVMPHNLYLHSSIVKEKQYLQDDESKSQAIKFATIDSTAALSLAFFINAAILILAGAIFYTNGLFNVSDIQDAYYLISPLLGTKLASILFGFALLASGQNATITGTLTGQIIMDGFLNIKMSLWLRRLVGRALAIIPASICIMIFGKSSIAKLMLLSQVVLSLQLPFAIIPLVAFTSSHRLMGKFKNNFYTKTISYIIAYFIAALNIWLIYASLNH